MRNLLLAALAVVATQAHAQPDFVFVNARVYTVDDGFTVAQAFAVEDGMFAAIGSNDDVRASIGISTKVIDLGGRTVLPGLIDAHGHMAGLGNLQLGVLDLAGTTSYDEVIHRVIERAEQAEPGEWIIGRGWDHESWPDKELPTHERLSQAVPDNPVWLSRVDGHAGLGNARAMELAEVSEGSSAPSGGEMLRDQDARPTGVFVDNAMAMIGRVIPAGGASGEDLILAAQKLCLEAGLTGVHDARVGADMIEVYQRLERERKLHVRVFGMVRGNQAMQWFDEHEPYTGSFFSMRATKLYIDGAMGSRGAWLLEPYSDRPTDAEGKPYTGLAVTEPDFVKAVAEHALTKGYQVCTHAIGDRGNRELLDAYESAAISLDADLRDARFRIEHAQLIAPEDIGRFAELGVIPSMQPTHCTSDMRWVEERVGPVRADGAFVWQTLLASGARIAGGSDFPVESHNPFLGLYAAVSRQNLDEQPPGGWHPSERMNRLQALRAFTIDAAYAGFDEDRIGSIETDKLADFIVIDRDYMTCHTREIADIRVVATYVEGSPVYINPNFAE